MFDCLIDDDDFELVKNRNWFMGNGGRGYAICNFNKGNNTWTTISMSRLITNAPPGMLVDHINHNTLDNRKCNLRICSKRENAINRKKSKDTASRFKGVTVEGGKKNKKVFMRARIRVNDKLIHLGCFKTQELAAMAYDEAAKKYFGEFAHTNF